MAKAPTEKPTAPAAEPAPATPRKPKWPGVGGNFIRDKVTGELRPRDAAPRSEKQE